MFDGEAFGQQMVEIVRGYVATELAPIKAENEALRAEIDALKAVAPEKGEPGDPGEKGEAGKDGEPGRDGADGKDGVGLADALIDSEGNLVLTMTDGRTKSLGRVHGNNGEDGKTFTLDDFDIVPTDERTIEMSFQNGQVKHTFELEFPVPVYRDVWNEKAEYRRGDMVSWGGSVWHCDEPKGLKPDAPESGWTLAVKRGRDGKAK